MHCGIHPAADHGNAQGPTPLISQSGRAITVMLMMKFCIWEPSLAALQEMVC
jgi:hypothetical protein